LTANPLRSLVATDPDRYMEKEAICSLQGICKHYSVKKGFFAGATTKIKALNEVSLDIYSQEILGLVGESGCGKSTLARLILGLEKPTEGTIYFEGLELSSLDTKQLRKFRKRVQMVFQDPFSSLNPKKTIFQIISQPLRIHKICPKTQMRDEVKRLLSMAGFNNPGIENRYPHEFSGGQRQRIGIARALATRPDLIILDEPTSALDVSIQAQIINLILDLQESRKITCLFISHDLPIVEFVSHRIAVMYRGTIVEIMPKEAFALAGQRDRNPLHHPYTQFLIDSIPVPDFHKSQVGCQKDTKRSEIQEGPLWQKNNALESGCPFYTKCIRRTKECIKSRPSMVEVAKGHHIACHLFQLEQRSNQST